MRLNTVNSLIERELVLANVPALLVPSSLCRNDGKRPDGLTVLPWANGHCLVWDFTCPNTLATSHLNRPGAVANDEESQKSLKYLSLSAQYSFVPVIIETLIAPGDETLASGFWTAHHGYNRTDNAACIVGAVHPLVDWGELFYL